MVVYPYNGMLFGQPYIKSNELLIHATTWTNMENFMPSEISQGKKDHISYDSFYMKYPD